MRTSISGIGSGGPAGISRLAAALCLLAASTAAGGGPSPAGGRGTPPSAALPIEYLPADSPFYLELERLAARGALPWFRVEARPIPRGDVARALVEAVAVDPGLARDPGVRRLLRELAHETRRMGLPNPETDRDPGAETRPLVEWGEDDASVRIRIRGSGRARVEETRSFLFGPVSRLSAEGTAALRPRFLFHESLFLSEFPGRESFADPVLVGTDLVLLVDRAYFTARTDHVDFELGRDEVRWGLGRRGTLLLSDASGPFALFQYRIPVTRKVRALALNGKLGNTEKNPPNPVDYQINRFLAAHAIEIQPSPRLGITLSEAVRYDATGIEPMYLVNLIPYSIVERLLWKDIPSDTDKSARRNNVMWALSSWWNAARGTRLYGELLVDDFADRGNKPHKLAYQAGFLRAIARGGRRLFVQAEYTRVWNYVYSAYYVRDFIHQEAPLGFALGPDTENLSLWLDLDLSRDVALSLAPSFTRRGEGRLGVPWIPPDAPQGPPTPVRTGRRFLGTVERTFDLFGGAAWAPRDNLSAGVGVGVAFARNAENVRGVRETRLRAEASLDFRW